MTSAWTQEHVNKIDLRSVSRVPLITHAGRSGLEAGRIYWDMWPVQTKTGHIAQIDGREFWMALSAPDRGDPSLRHFEAKIRLLERVSGRWVDFGDALPAICGDYEREWAGCALFDEGRLTLFFTAAGTDKAPGGYQQRLFEAHAKIGAKGLPVDWTLPCQSVAKTSPLYMAAETHEGEEGKIKAFRDPAYFCDPKDGQEYLIFSGSLAQAKSNFNGLIGIARKGNSGWELLDPLIVAEGVNNELERAHVVFHEGRYYAFWVTQTHTFSDNLRHGPTGLYGMVADSLFGQYRPINGSGLVVANPMEEPVQAYSWFVSAELLVSSFVDFYGLDGEARPDDPRLANAFFGGVPAPLLRLTLAGDRCELADRVSA